MRPERLVLVAGTGTEVGKTYVSAALACALLARGLRVAARKPVQSFAPGDGKTDADVLAAATGEAAETVCPPHRWLPVPMAPPMALDVLGLGPISISDLVSEIAWPVGTDVGVVESVGGVRSPIANDGDTVDLANALQPDMVILVADARLGAVNAVLTGLPPILRWPVVVILNRYNGDDDLHRRNLRWLTDRESLRITTDIEDLASIAAHAHLPPDPALEPR